MACCPDTKFSFFNTSTTSIAYTPALRELYGNTPHVEVLYWDGTQYVRQGIFTEVRLVGSPVTSIVIDHGGISQGMVKIN